MGSVSEPTPKQEELFLVSIRNFLAKSDKHPLLLANSHLNIPVESFNDWINAKNLPEVAIRTRVIDFIWTHNCSCTCK